MKAKKIDLTNIYYSDSHPYVIEVYKENKFLGYSNGQSVLDSKNSTITPYINLNDGDGYRTFSISQMMDSIDKLRRLFNRDGYTFKTLNCNTKEYEDTWSDITAEDKYKFILYLDMDGVTAGSNYIVKIHNALVNKDDENKDFEYRNFMQHWCFQREAVEFLNKLYDMLPYTIVLSTTRRFELTIPEWNLIYKLNDVKAHIDGITRKIPNNNHISWRENEIEEYHFRDRGILYTLKNIPFLIVDDDCFDLQKYKDKLIHVNTETGLTMDYFSEALEKLKAQDVKIDNIEGETK